MIDIVYILIRVQQSPSFMTFIPCTIFFLFYDQQNMDHHAMFGARDKKKV